MKLCSGCQKNLDNILKDWENSISPWPDREKCYNPELKMLEINKTCLEMLALVIFAGDKGILDHYLEGSLHIDTIVDDSE
jgi:hypothetical protein